MASLIIPHVLSIPRWRGRPRRLTRRTHLSVSLRSPDSSGAHTFCTATFPHQEKPMSHTLRVVLALALVGGTTGAAAQSTNTLYACVNNASGAVHLVGPTTACTPNETLDTWNIVGPVGPQGPAGPAGTTGAAGAQ